MIREIKFRAWSGTMFLDGNDANIHPKNGDKTDIELEAGHHRPITLLQYTGLKDKNGTEIYEGDIVLILYSGWGSKHLGTPEQQAMTLKDYLRSIASKKVVVWSYNGFYVSHELGGHAESMECGEYGFIEVIGNIYENPSLLK